MKISELIEGPCDVAKPEEIEKMSGVEYDKYAQWKQDCEQEERTTPLSTKRLESQVTEKGPGFNKGAASKKTPYVSPGNPHIGNDLTGIPDNYRDAVSNVVHNIKNNKYVKAYTNFPSNIKKILNQSESYDDYHGDMSKEEYDKTVNNSEMEYTVWVGGTEANDNWLNYEDAVALYDKFKAQGHDDVQLDVRIKQDIPQDIPMGIKPIPKEFHGSGINWDEVDEAYNPETGRDPNVDTTEWDELIAKAKKKQEKKYANSKAGKRDPAYRHYHQYKTEEAESRTLEEHNLTNDDTRDIAIRIVDEMVKDGLIPDMHTYNSETDTDDDVAFQVQDIIHDELNKVLRNSITSQGQGVDEGLAATIGQGIDDLAVGAGKLAVKGAKAAAPHVKKGARKGGKMLKKGMKKLSKLGSKKTSTSFDKKGNATTNTTYGMANAKEESLASSLIASRQAKRESVKEKAKPDFLDLDKDGDKKEPMKQAGKTKKEVCEDEEAVAARDEFMKVMDMKPKGGLKDIPKAIDTIKQIVADKQNMQVKFDDGKMKVDLYTASAISQIYDAVGTSTQGKIDDMLRTKEGMLRMSNFAFSKLKEGRLDEIFFAPLLAPLAAIGGVVGRAVAGVGKAAVGAGARAVAGGVKKLAGVAAKTAMNHPITTVAMLPNKNKNKNKYGQQTNSQTMTASKYENKKVLTKEVAVPIARAAVGKLAAKKGATKFAPGMNPNSVATRIKPGWAGKATTPVGTAASQKYAPGMNPNSIATRIPSKAGVKPAQSGVGRGNAAGSKSTQIKPGWNKTKAAGTGAVASTAGTGPNAGELAKAKKDARLGATIGLGKKAWKLAKAGMAGAAMRSGFGNPLTASKYRADEMMKDAMEQTFDEKVDSGGASGGTIEPKMPKISLKHIQNMKPTNVIVTRARDSHHPPAKKYPGKPQRGHHDKSYNLIAKVRF